MNHESITKQRLENERQHKLKTLPEKYILLIQTPTKAYVVEGQKDFTEYNNRLSTMTAWFEFLMGLVKIPALKTLNQKYRLSYFPPNIATPSQFYGMTMQHLQDGTVCFGGRALSRCDVSSEETTEELINYFEELNYAADDEVQGHLQKYNFAVYEK